MSSSCDVKQIYSGRAYLNIEDIPGMIGVWGSTYQEKTILILDGINFYLYQFESDEYYNEWMEENQDKYRDIIELKYSTELKTTILVQYHHG